MRLIQPSVTRPCPSGGVSEKGISIMVQQQWNCSGWRQFCPYDHAIFFFFYDWGQDQFIRKEFNRRELFFQENFRIHVIPFFAADKEMQLFGLVKKAP